jgi:hypothetical protein
MPMNKGIDALEIVFAMFILIVVTLVVIKLFTGIVTENSLPPLNDFKESYNYDKEKNMCSNLCTRYTQGECADLESAVTFCQHKVSISIDGNYKTGEAKHFGIVAKIPYCEDGLYCFNIYKTCGCGGYDLDAQTCKDIMNDFYASQGFSQATTNSMICNSILPGECEKDPRRWTGTNLPAGFTPQAALGSDAAYGVGNPPYIGADYWWKYAGYGDICKAGTSGATTTTVASSSQVSLSCTGTPPSTSTGNDGRIDCNVQCGDGILYIAGSDVNGNTFYQDQNVQTTTTKSMSFSGLTQPGGDTKKYAITLDCQSPIKMFVLVCDQNLVCATATSA